MNKRVGLNQLERYVGLSIIDICVELFVFEQEVEPIGLMMRLSNESRFVFCCSGDGKIRIRKDSDFKTQGDCQLAFIKEFSGEILKSIHAIENQLILRTGNHEIRIVNDDDELDLYLDGHQMLFSFESES